MVYTQIDVIRGIIIPAKLLLEIYNSEIAETQSTLDDMYNDIYELIEWLNEQYITSNKFSFRKVSPCCSENKDIILGISTKTYKRLRWSKEEILEKLDEIKSEMIFTRNVIPQIKNMFKQFVSTDISNLIVSYLPVNTLNDEQFNDLKNHSLRYKSKNVFCGKNRCGYLFVCDDCLGITENGKYDVNEMFEHTVECKEETPKDPFSNLTIETFIDENIKEICDEISADFDYNKIPIKNYYCLDDCLSCS